MELKELESSLIGYYGKHQNENVQSTSIEYIKGTYTSQAYRTLLQEIMKTHPFNYGFPDVSAIEKASEYYFRKEQKSLRLTKPSNNEWAVKYEALTELERKEAEPLRGRWKDLLSKDVKHRTNSED